MHALNEKGILTILVAGAVITLLLFTISASLNSQQNEDSLTKMQTARELNIKMNNTIRLLDKATSDVFFDNMSPPACNVGGPRPVIARLNEIAESMGCEIINMTVNPGAYDIKNGELECSVTSGNLIIKQKINFEFTKDGGREGSPPDFTCYLEDTLTGIREFP